MYFVTLMLNFLLTVLAVINAACSLFIYRRNAWMLLKLRQRVKLSVCIAMSVCERWFGRERQHVRSGVSVYVCDKRLCLYNLTGSV